MTRPVTLQVLVAALFLLAAPRFSRASETIVLRPGFQKILGHTTVTRLSIGNPEVIEAAPLPRGQGVVVVGKKEGSTDLVVWEAGTVTEWTVEVRERRPDLLEEATALAAPFPSLTVRRVGEAVIISGTVATPREKALLEQFARNRPHLHLDIGLPEDQRRLLVYDLKIIEIGRGAASQLGVRWPDSVGLNAALSGESGSGFVARLDSGFEARLEMLLADGRARVLANPQLVCETGSDASFLAGGEIPIVIATPETRTVEWKTYGIILKLTPTLEGQDRIRTRITAEISSVDHGSGASNIPGLLTRRVSTFFTTGPGRTVMLSGLVKNEMAKDVAKVPLLGQIPVLGELFKSRSFRENQSELAIFITPREARPDSADELAAWNERAGREKNAMRYRLLD